jgi:hypothetical protein
MWMAWPLGFFLLVIPVFADPGFDENYERDYNIFNRGNRYASNNQLNPAQTYAPDACRTVIYPSLSHESRTRFSSR